MPVCRMSKYIHLDVSESKGILLCPMNKKVLMTQNQMRTEKEIGKKMVSEGKQLMPLHTFLSC